MVNVVLSALPGPSVRRPGGGGDICTQFEPSMSNTSRRLRVFVLLLGSVLRSSLRRWKHEDRFLLLPPRAQQTNYECLSLFWQQIFTVLTRPELFFFISKLCYVTLCFLSIT